ncbi:MAG: 3-oxoacyl-[acyl-carrier-protein] synthase III C-terminal domain-containing protein [Actinomycetia bacterium]|nr:3-oxoacyl-[acyl-carrier-protein] synthase III C-terminal domain-containing protein [Actinomycetes bacterium]
MHSRIASVATAFPPHRYAQRELTDMFASVVGLAETGQVALLRRLHDNAGVAYRHLALPLHRYAALAGFTEANDEYARVAVDLSAHALEAALTGAGLDPGSVDLIITATVTGLTVPSLDARLVTRAGLRPDVKRMPLIGLGCVAGAAGLARAHDYLAGHPHAVVALVCVELCSLTVQCDDTSTANLVASGLFGDGAACVILTGEAHPLAASADDGPRASHAGRGGPTVLATCSRFYPETERVMGFDVGTHGMRIVLDAVVPELVRTHLRSDVDAFLAGHGLSREDLDFFVAHPGGPKVLDALAEALEVPPEALGVTWRSLREVGNMSSVSVLHVLEETLRERPPEPGSLGLLLAMGPGFCSELVLVEG